MPQNKKKTNQSGNVFIIILVAVFLFGALMFTFSRSGSQSVSTMSRHEAKIAAQELISFFNLVDVAYNKLRMKGCSETEISFANSGDTGTFITVNDSTTAPVDKSCHVFDPNGGKIPFNVDWTKYQIPQSEMSSPNNYGNIYFKQTGSATVGIGTAANDIMVHINFIQPEICLAYNKILNNGIDTSIDDDGSTVGDENTSYVGKENFCRYFNTTSSGQIRKIWIAK